MTSTPSEFPRVDADLSGNGVAEVTALGLTHSFIDGPAGTAIDQALAYCARIASAGDGVGRELYINCSHKGEPTGRLVVTPFGDYYAEDDPSQRFHIQDSATATDAAATPPPAATSADAAAHAHTTHTATETDSAQPSINGQVREPSKPGARAARTRFISTEPVTEPAERGWRGLANQAGFRVAPSPDELTRRDDERLVAGHWPGLRTIAVVNPKGGSGKSVATPALAAVFARYGGGGVLAWDNNETRGTLGWRTEQSHTHEATVLDLIPHAERLLAATAAHGDIAGYVHHQTRDKYDVLRSDQSVVGDHEVTGEEVDIIHSVAARYYRLVIIDSGNNERAANWRAMIGHANQIVVPCTNSTDTAEAAGRMLEALHQRDDHCRRLAASAVVIVSQRTPGRDPDVQHIVDGFRPLVRDVVTIGHDVGLKAGHIAYDNLRRDTQRQWLTAAAAVARGL